MQYFADFIMLFAKSQPIQLRMCNTDVIQGSPLENSVRLPLPFIPIPPLHGRKKVRGYVNVNMWQIKK